MSGPAASGTSDPGPRSDHRRNREAILDAAIAEFATDARTTTADVARRAGLTRATVYRHFPDRDTLIDAIVGRLAGPLVDGLLERVEEGPLEEALGVLAGAVVDLASQYRELLQVVAARLDELARQAVDDEPLTAALGRRRARGELSSPLSDAWLAACVRALCLAAIADERPPAVVATELAATLRLLVSRPPDPRDR